jgi:hypothetical protein
MTIQTTTIHLTVIHCCISVDKQLRRKLTGIDYVLPRLLVWIVAFINVYIVACEPVYIQCAIDTFVPSYIRKYHASVLIMLT